MKYKKEVAQAMAAMLKNELRKLDGNIRSNAWKINRLGEDNAILKRQRTAIAKLIGEWEKC